MFKKLSVFIGVIAISCAVYAVSESNQTVANSKQSISAIDKAAVNALIENNTRLKVEDIQASVVPGFADVFTDQGMFYVSNDGQFFIAGKVYQQIEGKGLIDAGDHHLSKMRLDGVKKFENDMIVYPAKDEKYVVNVFTDITCGYCRKLHAEMAQYNELGITVRYLAYPRYGKVGRDGKLTDAFKDLRSIWCSDTPESALTKAKSGGTVPYRVCDAPVEEQLSFGRQIGVNGTPAIILEDGSLIPGYKPPKDLLTALENI